MLPFKILTVSSSKRCLSCVLQAIHSINFDRFTRDIIPIRLTLLDLTAAFDTIDHFFVLERLSSWFGLTSDALCWSKSGWLNRSFSVTIKGYQLLYNVPQDTALGPLLFILYFTALRKVISDSSLSHKLNADDTHLYVSFLAVDSSRNITRFLLTDQNARLNQWQSSRSLKTQNKLPNQW
jgi:hypothetical protein